jgi:hypothetical protein
VEKICEMLSKILNEVLRRIEALKMKKQSCSENMCVKSSPFANKTADELDQMFCNKKFWRQGLDPLRGQGSYINPKNGRRYRIHPHDKEI